MEEFIGKLWHNWVTKAATGHYPQAAVKLGEVEKTAGILFRAFGGDPGLNVAAATADTHGARRRWLQRVAGSNERVALARRDSETLRLPPEIAAFPEKSLNRDLYLWLAALAACDVAGDCPWFIRNQLASQAALARYPGLRPRYERLVAAHIAGRIDPAQLQPDEAAQENAIRQALRQPASVAGLPPLNGFVSEWLLLQSFLFTAGLPQGYLNMLLPAVAGAVALIAALAGFAMVKFFGVVFLGQPRDEKLAQAHDAGSWERLGMLWLVAGCVLLGLMPNQVIALIDPVTQTLVHAGLAQTVAQNGWLLVPVNITNASYSPIIFLCGVLASFGLTFWLVRRFYHGRLRRVPPWDCGHPWQTARMQDTAEGFGQPIRQVFEPFFRMKRQLPSAFDAQPSYRVTVEDPLWHGLYLNVAKLVDRLSRLIGLLQQGRIAVYLMYSFVTLIVVLLMVKR